MYRKIRGPFGLAASMSGLTPGLTAGSPTSFSSFADQSFYDAEFSYDSGGHCRDRAPDTYLDWPYGESDFDVDGAFYVDYSHRDHEEYSVTLPVTVASNAAVNEQCVTVEMFALGERGNPGTGVITPMTTSTKCAWARLQTMTCWC